MDEWKLDLHLHSSYSPDGEVPPAELVRRAVEKGLRGMALTDHNSTKGIGQAEEAARDYPGFIVVPGTEVSSASGHIVALGVRSPPPAGLPVSDTVERILSAGGLPVAAHPYRNFTGLDEESVRRARFVAVEVLNGRSPRRKNLRACRLCRSLGLGLSAGSDAHRVPEVGRCCVIVDDDPGGAEGMLERLRTGRTRTWGRSASLIDVGRAASKMGREWLRRGGKRI